MREVLWENFRQRGFDIYGEVTLDDGRIDLIAETPNGERWGVEIKNRWRLIEWGDYDGWDEPEDNDRDTFKESELRALSEQVAKYAETGQLDKVFIATQNPAPLQQRFSQSKPVFDGSKLFSDTQDSPWVNLIDYAGFIQTGVLSPSAVSRLRARRPTDRPLCDAGRETTILKHGEKVSPPQRNDLTFKTQSEPEVAHACWSAFDIAIREGVLPNHKGNSTRQIDVVAFTGEPQSSVIYQRDLVKKGHHIIGFEAKETASPGMLNQLKRYAQSGALTKLYLAVPEAEVERAVDLVSSADTLASAAGVVGVRNSDSQLVQYREPEALELELAGLYIGKDDSLVSEIGWGRAWNHKSVRGPVFNQAMQSTISL